MTRFNEFNQPIGAEVAHWQPRQRPARVSLEGRFCRLEALSVEDHGADLTETLFHESPDSIWTYMFTGPYGSEEEFLAFLRTQADSEDPLHFAIIDKTLGKAVGTLALMRIDPANGAIEVGWVMYSSLLQRTAAATEAQFLLMRYAMDDLGYRRYEWKCDALNEPSRRAALRLGFQFEGIFRNALVYKRRSRDTAWFAFTNDDWATLRPAFESWLAPENFDDDGAQRFALTQFQKKLGG